MWISPKVVAHDITWISAIWTIVTFVTIHMIRFFFCWMLMTLHRIMLSVIDFFKLFYECSYVCFYFKSIAFPNRSSHHTILVFFAAFYLQAWIVFRGTFHATQIRRVVSIIHFFPPDLDHYLTKLLLAIFFTCIIWAVLCSLWGSYYHQRLWIKWCG